ALRSDEGAHHLPLYARPGRPGPAISIPGVTAPPLILASASPRRLELLARLGIEPARVVHADIDETSHKAELPRDYAQRMAREKAFAALGGAATDDASFVL